MSKCALSLCVCVCDPFPGIFFSLFSFGARSRQLPSKAGSDLPISYILLSSLVHYPWKNPRRFPISRNYAGLAHSIFSKENPREQAMNFHFPSLTFLGKPSGKQKTRRTPQPRSSPFIPEMGCTTCMVVTTFKASVQTQPNSKIHGRPGAYTSIEIDIIAYKPDCKMLHSRFNASWVCIGLSGMVAEMAHDMSDVDESKRYIA